MSRLGLYLRLLLSLFATSFRTLGAFWDHRLWPIMPMVFLLLTWAIVLWAINTISPLAPFVYSLI